MVAVTTKSSVFRSIVVGGFMTNVLAATTTDVFFPGISTALAVTLTPVGSANGANTFLVVPTSAPPHGPTGTLIEGTSAVQYINTGAGDGIIPLTNSYNCPLTVANPVALCTFLQIVPGTTTVTDVFAQNTQAFAQFLAAGPTPTPSPTSTPIGSSASSSSSSTPSGSPSPSSLPPSSSPAPASSPSPASPSPPSPSSSSSPPPPPSSTPSDSPSPSPPPSTPSPASPSPAASSPAPSPSPAAASPPTSNSNNTTDSGSTTPLVDPNPDNSATAFVFGLPFMLTLGSVAGSFLMLLL